MKILLYPLHTVTSFNQMKDTIQTAHLTINPKIDYCENYLYFSANNAVRNIALKFDGQVIVEAREVLLDHMNLASDYILLPFSTHRYTTTCPRDIRVEVEWKVNYKVLDPVFTCIAHARFVENEA